MSRLYLSAPLPFVGQKRMFAKHFIEVIKQYPAGTVFVDLFGGSGLLSHITKHFHPESRVIYNDFDDYRLRIANIPRTNALLDRIRPIASQFPRHKPVTGNARDEIFRLLEHELKENGYLDFITLDEVQDEHSGDAQGDILQQCPQGRICRMPGLSRRPGD